MASFFLSLISAKRRFWLPLLFALCLSGLGLSGRLYAADPNWPTPHIIGVWQHSDGTVTVLWEPDPDPDANQVGDYGFSVDVRSFPFDDNTGAENINGPWSTTIDSSPPYSLTFPFSVQTAGVYYVSVRGFPRASAGMGSLWSATYAIYLSASPTPVPPPQNDPTPTDTPGGGANGPSNPDPVDVATGTERDQSTDITVYNPSGPAVSFGREYRSAQAKASYGSPGMSVGWSHTYDCQVYGPLQPGTWSALTLIYPNGAQEALTPTLNGQGQPTGAFSSPTGESYFATGVPGSSAGQWQSITITWDDQTQWQFTPIDGTYAPESDH